MSIGIIASLIAFTAYGGLLILVYQKGIRGERSKKLFFFYILDMVFLQATYYGISVAHNETRALLLYTLNIPISSSQVILYFFFVRDFLGLKHSRNLVWGSILIWLLVLGISIAFRSKIFTAIYQDPLTGMFLPEIGSIASVLSIPTIFFLGATFFELARNYRNQSRSQQARIQYLFLSIFIVWVGMAANINPAWQPYAIDVIANIVSALLIGYAILRYQLLELHTVLRKGSEIFVSVAVFGAGNFLVILLFNKLFHLNANVKNVGMILALTIITSLVILVPLRDRIQQYFGQTLFKTTYDGYAMIQRLGQTATSILDLQKLSKTLLDDVADTLQSQWGILLVKEKDGGFKPIAWNGIPDDALFSLDKNHPVIKWVTKNKVAPIAYSYSELPLSSTGLGQLNLIGSEFIPLKTRGELIGILWLGAKLKGRSYSQDDKTNLVTVANNIASTIDNARLYKELQKQAIRDPLTGLFNRRYLYETFDRELARAKRENYPISIIMIDIDRFKEINDTYGHQVGDEALAALGDLLQHSTRQGDIACRYGGDEFLIIMPGLHTKDAERRAEFLRERVKSIPIDAGEESVFVTASIGIAFYPEHGDSLDQIMKASDDALYKAKNAGRNRISIWTGDDKTA